MKVSSYLGTLDSDEIDAALSCASSDKQSLTAPRRAIQQLTSGWANTKSFKGIRMHERPLDALPKLLNRGGLPADVCVSDGHGLEEHRP